MRKIVLLSALVLGLLCLSPLSNKAHAFTSLGAGDSSLLGGDLTNPGDDIEMVPEVPNMTEDMRKPKNAAWLKMTFEPRSAPGAVPHYSNPYTSWVGCPAAAIFYNTPETKKWYISFKDGGRGGPRRDAPYYCAVELDKPYILTHFTINNSPDMPERDPKSWAIQGSNTGKKDEWTDIFICDVEQGDQSPFKKYPRNETVLYTSFTSENMAKVVTPADLEKLTSKLDKPIVKADFATPTNSFTWFRVAIYSCVNRNSTSVADPNAPPGFALGQLELFGVPAKAAVTNAEPAKATSEAPAKATEPAQAATPAAK
jgi:hypothetical protein